MSLSWEEQKLFELSRLQHRWADQHDGSSRRLLAIFLTSAPEHIHESLAKLVTEEAVDERITRHGAQSEHWGEVHEHTEANRLKGEFHERLEQYSYLKR